MNSLLNADSGYVLWEPVPFKTHASPLSAIWYTTRAISGLCETGHIRICAEAHVTSRVNCDIVFNVVTVAMILYITIPYLFHMYVISCQ